MSKHKRYKYGTYNEGSRKRLQHKRNRYNKNDYNDGTKNILNNNEDIEESEYSTCGEDCADNTDDVSESSEIGDGNHVVNNIIPSQKYENSDLKKNSSEVGSNAMDVLKSLYEGISNYKQKMPIYTRQFLKDREDIKVDEVFENEIKKSEQRKDNLKSVGGYKAWSNKLSVPLTRLFEQMDEKGKISVTKFDDFYEDCFVKFKKQLLESLDDKNASDQLKNFVNKSLECVEKIDKNCGPSFDPTKMRYNVGILSKDVCYLYDNKSIIELIFNAILGIFNFNDFHQDIAEVRLCLDKLYSDIESYYELPLKKRQEVVDSMNSKLSRIRFLLSGIYGVKEKDMEIVKEMLTDLKEAMSTTVDASGIIVDFIIAFGGEKSLEYVNIKSINKDVYDCVMLKLADAIKNSCGLSKDESIKIAKSILNKEKKPDDIEENIAAFYDGKVKEEYDKMLDDFDKKSSFEDVKITCNRNLQKVDAINKTTSSIITNFTQYVSNCLTNIYELEQRCLLLETSGCVVDVDGIRNTINSFVDQLSMVVDQVANDYKLFYEYIDDKKIRKDVINETNEKFKKLKESMKKSIEDCLCDSSGKPKHGKEAEFEKINNMLGDMKNIAELCFSNWETVRKIIEDAKKKIQQHKIVVSNDERSKKDSKRSKKAGKNNLFHLVANKANIENNLLHKMIDHSSNYERRRYPFMMY